jgi:hypothetical protein
MEGNMSIKEINMNLAQLINEAIDQSRKDIKTLYDNAQCPPEARLEFVYNTYVPIIESLTAALEKVTAVSRYF